MKHLSRRRFLSCGAVGGLALLGPWSCREEAERLEEKPKARSKTARRPKAVQPPAEPAGTAWVPFPLVEVRGTPFEVGSAVGSMTADRIRAGIEARREWFEDLKRFALADRAARLDGFVAATGKHHPDVLAEIQGLAAGAGLLLDDILVLNLQTELGALKAAQSTCADACSTLAVVGGGRALLAHNEDGHDAYRRLMVLLRIAVEKRPAVTALSYPGIVPGNVPAMNDAGLAVTTNFIGARDVRVGVPRYVLGRAVHQAQSLDEALRIAGSPEAAYSFHLNLGSVAEKRIVALDVAPGARAEKEVEGVFLQTNHFVLPETQAIPQPENTPGGSSDSRYRVLAARLPGLPPPDRIGEADLLALLSSHEAVAEPYAPCRHPKGAVQGRTLATAFFDLGAGTFALYEGNPCEHRRRVLRGA